MDNYRRIMRKERRRWFWSGFMFGGFFGWWK